MVRWFMPLLNILLQGVSEVTNYEMVKFFSSYDSSQNFIRINPPVVLGNSSGQDASEENMKHLHQDACNYIATNKDFLNNIAEQLVKEDIKHNTLLF